MGLHDYFAVNPMFTVHEFNKHQDENGTDSKWTRKALLAYHCKQGHIKQVRRGLYAAVPPEASPDTFTPDPYLIAAKISKDSILSFHTALEIQGLGYSIFHEYYFFSHKLKFHSESNFFCLALFLAICKRTKKFGINNLNS